MPNYQESKSEKLMIELCDKLSQNQNELFSLCLEESAQCGMDIDDIIKKYQNYDFMPKTHIRQVFRVLIQVLECHLKESVENFENLK